MSAIVHLSNGSFTGTYSGLANVPGVFSQTINDPGNTTSLVGNPTQYGFTLNSYNTSGSASTTDGSVVNILIIGQGTAVPPLSVNGFSAYQFTHGLGYDTHISYLNTSYGAPNAISYRKAILLALHAKLVRDGSSLLDSAPNAYTAEMNDLANSGMRWALVVDSGTPTSVITARINALNTNALGYLEGPNELNTRDANWAIDDKNEMIQMVAAVNAASPSRGLQIIGPSITNTYTTMGDLSSLENYGNYHYYSGAFIPESDGWGGGVYGYRYGDLRSGLNNARQSSLTKPIAMTETGNEVQPIPPNAGVVGGYVSEYSQASYIERRTLWAALHNVPLIFQYDLFSEGYTSTDFNWGLIRADGTQRPSLRAMQGLTNILDDTADISQPCHVPVAATIPPPHFGITYYLTTDTVESMGFCKSNGEYDLVLWQPLQTTDINTGADIAPPAPLSVAIQFDSGFTPTSSTLWSSNTSFNWSNTGSITTSGSSVSITDRPEILVFNGAVSPTPLPALPTPAALLPSPSPTP